MGCNTAIAKAAAAAGFDVTDTDNLLNLTNAIREADRAIYPDHYKGSARYKSDLYPQHWVAAEMCQTRGMREYRDLGRIPSLSAFDVSAQETVREQLDDNALPYPTRRTDFTADREPLGPRMSNKRTVDDCTPRSASKIRKLREDHSTAIESFHLTQRTEFDPGQEENAVNASARSCSSRSALRNLANYRRMAPSRSSKKKQEAQHMHQQPVHTTTDILLYRVLQGLKLSKATIGKNREILSERWEIDAGLQLQTVTDDLQRLNECFSRAGNAIREAITVVEERLL